MEILDTPLQSIAIVHSGIRNVNLLKLNLRGRVPIYTVRIKIKVIHIQRPIVLKTIDLKICMWHISEEQLILFPYVPSLHQVCHA